MAHDPEDHPPGVPRWVKVSLIAVAALIALLVILMATGVLGGDHGPGRHLSAVAVLA
ncbi:hypothetical protein SAMN05192558_10220 [Actinokineospora alba]|uniref:Uncharacterized protein n=1 Tax=Actinokineospora alba TaxID=504798 RepID=A0A1H0H9D8_9PSEU|nr:hypothetical protein [Actinokineospora alba]TDP64981.1 hypothetical protein C8E96_0459 [Actinokineospora alba]SDH51004.1 hypothetical protein SAMN05421871_101283 [Actinokineospora alba]SDO15690.1 hypothetical protein SAMN05192558_10220 [Actinokineospora alba]